MWRKASTLVLLALFASLSAALPVVDPITSRMVGGKNSGAKQAAVSASIVSLQTSLYGHFCAGSILSANWILTAAHCTKNRLAGTIIARVGSANHKSGGTLHEVSVVHIHASYNTVTHLNDISTVRTKTAIAFSEKVHPIALDYGALPLDTTLTVFGWGRPDMRPQTEIPARLKYLTAKTISTADCSERLRLANLLQSPVLPSTVCTAPKKDVGVCSGNGGGPAVVGDKMVAIVSYVARCAMTGVPDLLTGVQYYRQWIYDHSH